VAGLETATAGDVLLGGARVNHLPARARNVAMVFQFYALYPSLSVRENLEYPLHAERAGRAEIERRVRSVSEKLQLGHILDRLPGQLAEGEKQRVAVGRSIIRNAVCFLFDEPLSRLDVQLRETMRGQIKEVLEGLNKATVIVTHDQLEALTMADRIAIMRDGIIEQIATPHEVFARPANIFVASFIGTPQMNLIEVDLKTVEGRRASVGINSKNLEIEVDRAVSELKPSRVTIGIRPRALYPCAQAGTDTFMAKAELIEPMGAETLIHARGEAGYDIRVVLPRDIKVKIGETLHLKPDPRQTHIFSGEGRAVRS
jgi:multiple sugar transport system ATP-binding protein